MAAITQTRPSAPAIRTPLFIVGVALALLAFVLMLAFGIIFAGKAQAIGQVRVIVAAQDIAPREPITLDMVAYGSVASTSVPKGAITRETDVSGYSALVSIPKGQVITGNVISSNPDVLSGAQSEYLPIPKGYVAVTLPTSEQQGVAGFVAQGDYLDIIATVNTGLITPTTPRQVTRTVFNNVYVIRVGPESTVPRQGVAQGLSSSLTVVMSLCDAQYMTWFILNASLKYALLAYPDYGNTPSAGTPDCPSTTEPGIVGPAQVDSRYGFTR